MLNAAGDKSFVDDLAASGYCKCESSLCCYEALRFIPCFYDLFFFVFKISKRASMVCRIFARTGFGCEFPRLESNFAPTICQTSNFQNLRNRRSLGGCSFVYGAFLPERFPSLGTQQSSALLDNLEITPSARPHHFMFLPYQ